MLTSCLRLCLVIKHTENIEIFSELSVNSVAKVPLQEVQRIIATKNDSHIHSTPGGMRAAGQLAFE